MTFTTVLSTEVVDCATVYAAENSVYDPPLFFVGDAAPQSLRWWHEVKKVEIWHEVEVSLARRWYEVEVARWWHATRVSRATRQQQTQTRGCHRPDVGVGG